MTYVFCFAFAIINVKTGNCIILHGGSFSIPMPWAGVQSPINKQQHKFMSQQMSQ